VSARAAQADIGCWLPCPDAHPRADPTTEATPGTGADRTRLTLTTLEGSLILDGTGEIGPNGVRFRGTAKAAPGSEDALNNLLNIIGRRNGALSAISIG